MAIGRREGAGPGAGLEDAEFAFEFQVDDLGRALGKDGPFSGGTEPEADTFLAGVRSGKNEDVFPGGIDG